MEARMARGKTSQAGDATQMFTAVPPPAAALTAPQMKQFWKAQDKILAEAEAFARHWFARRHAATKAALKACEEAAEANPTDALAALQAFRDWQAQSAERMAEDVREWVDMWGRCAGHFVTGEVTAGAETLDELQREGAELHSRHATPV
jgi:hypothetical protein